MTRRTQEEKKFYYTMPGLYRKKIEELENTEEKVAWLLKLYPTLRNSDKLLLFYYWKIVDKYEGELTEETIMALTPAESIRRVRQKIQNDLGLFLPIDSEMLEKRKICEEAVREWVISEKKMI